jgi:nucleoside-diphosphate-sugar epimerase
MTRLFCFGLGYAARVLARRRLAAGWAVAGTARHAMPAEPDLAPLAFDRDHPLPAGALSGTTHILSSVPPDALGDAVLDGCRQAILDEAGQIRWIGYLSSTGVYGDHGGGWVDETTPAQPSSARARQRQAAETAWLALHRRHGLPVHVFRLAGIYGPGRSALEEARAGTARRIVKPGQVFSRINVDDIAAVLEASMARPNGGAVYNVCDDEAAPPEDVVSFACGLLGVPPPPAIPFDQADLSPMAQTFWIDNKRVRNDRIKQELGVVLRYPTYREGLRALVEHHGEKRDVAS